MIQPPVIILLAAGSSSRMRGGDKQLELVSGEPLLRRLAKCALSTEASVYVALPASNHPRCGVIADLGVTQIYVPDADQGMGVSISRSTQAVLNRDPSAIMFCPTDMPELTKDHFLTLIDAWTKAPEHIAQAIDSTGQPGHPVIFPKDYFDALRRLNGDKGAKAVMAGQEITSVQFKDNGPSVDLDTPEAWRDWRLGSPAP